MILRPLLLLGLDQGLLVALNLQELLIGLKLLLRQIGDKVGVFDQGLVELVLKGLIHFPHFCTNMLIEIGGKSALDGVLLFDPLGDLLPPLGLFFAHSVLSLRDHRK